MKQHPFYNKTGTNILPSQNISKKKKNDEWKEANMDALENIARMQYTSKVKLLKNYQLANGELLKEEYGETNEEGEFDFLVYVEDQLGMTDFIKNYDIISQPFNTMKGEMDALPDVFTVVGRGDIFESERGKVKNEMLSEWFNTYLENKILQNMERNGYNIPENEEEQQQFQEVYEQQRQVLSPPEIEKYMSTQYRHKVELWGEYEMKDQFDRFNIKECRKDEFHHYLCSGERFRHLSLGPDGLKVTPTNPIFTFSHKSPNEKFVQNGDYAGIVELMSIPGVIDNLGHLMTDEQINSLEEGWKSYNTYPTGKPVKDLQGNTIDYLSPTNLPYGQSVWTDDDYINNWFPRMRDYNNAVGFINNEIELSKIDGGHNSLHQTMRGMLTVTRAYWKSQERIGLLNWTNPNTGMPESIIVDEDFVVPKYIKQIKNERFDKLGEMDTLTWTRVTQVWEGTKINNFAGGGFLEKPLYLNVKPADIQIGKLLIAGQYCNNLNTKPSSFIDRIKPLAFFYNVLMNQAFHAIQTEILPFAVMESTLIPKGKDWGGIDSIRKWLGIGHADGVAPIDSSLNNTGAPAVNSGGQYPKIVDIDRANRIITRFTVAEQVRQLALVHVGITPQRMGDIKTSSTATGTNEAISRSYTQTSSWFTDFFDCERDILQMQLDAAKYLQQGNKEVSASYVKSDFTLQSLKLEEDLSLYDLHIYVTNNQEEQRNLNLAQRLALENNTSDMLMSDRLKLATSGNVREIITGLVESERQMFERQQQQYALQRQQIESNETLSREEKEFELLKQARQIEADLKEATIKALGFQRDGDMDQNNSPDVLDYANTVIANQRLENENFIKSRQLNLEETKENNRKIEKAKDQELQKQKIQGDQKIMNKKVTQARILGDKSK